MLSVLIVADSVLIRLALKQILREEYRHVSFLEAKTGAEALGLVENRIWKLLIVPTRLPDQDPFSLIRQIRQHPSKTDATILVLGPGDEDAYHSARAEQFGAAGYVPMNTSRNDLVRAIKEVVSGRKVFAHEPSAEEQVTDSCPESVLSTREYEVMTALVAGKPTKEIAAELNLDARTISTYKRRIFNKLRISSTAELARYTLKHRMA